VEGGQKMRDTEDEEENKYKNRYKYIYITRIYFCIDITLLLQQKAIKRVRKTEC